MNWYCKKFSDLSAEEIFDLLALRTAVFIIEQNCPYQDADFKDKKSHHVFCLNNIGETIACARIVEPGVSYPELSLGRVCSRVDQRGSGLGRELMLRTLAYAEEIYGNVPVCISAQLYLKNYYTSFGFEQISEVYPEDDIPHIKMLRKAR